MYIQLNSLSELEIYRLLMSLVAKCLWILCLGFLKADGKVSHYLRLAIFTNTFVGLLHLY